MDLNQQPGIKIISIYQIKCSFMRFPRSSGSISNEFKFSYRYDCQSELAGLGELTLVSSGKDINDGGKVYESQIVYAGSYTVDPDSQNMDLQEFLRFNAPATLIPYVRESLSSLSAKAGLPAIVLPPINVLALTNPIEDKQTKLDGNHTK